MIDTTALFGGTTAESAPSTGDAPASLDGFAAMLDQQLGAAAHVPVGPFGLARLAGEPTADAPMAPVLGFGQRRPGGGADTEADGDTPAQPGVGVPVSTVLRLLSGDLGTGDAADVVTAPGSVTAGPAPDAPPVATVVSDAAPSEVPLPAPNRAATVSPVGDGLGGSAAVGHASAASSDVEASASPASPAAASAPASPGANAARPPSATLPDPADPSVIASPSARSPIPSDAGPTVAPTPAVVATPVTEAAAVDQAATLRPAGARMAELASDGSTTEQPSRARTDAVAEGPRVPAAVPAGDVAGSAAPNGGPITHLVDRIVAVVDMLHDQPPPRSFIIEVPQLDGTQIRVALRADGTVHLGVAGDRPAHLAMPIITAARAALGDRGFDLGPDSQGRPSHPERDDVVEILGRGRRTTRPIRPGLRI